MNIHGVLRAVTPGFVLEIARAQRDLAATAGFSQLHSWVSACSPGVRSAIERSRLSLFPLSLRRRLSFVIDIGANEGQWLSSLVRLLEIREAWVFEPNPQAMLQCRNRLRNQEGVEFMEVALGSVSGRAVLHVTRSSDFSSLLQPNSSVIQANYADNPAQIIADRAVRILPLDDIVPADKSVDLLKIDVQGVEREVLGGARRTLKNTTAVLLEVNFRSHYDGDETFGPLHSLMTDTGFRLWSMSPPYRGPSGEALWADALFLRVEK